MGVGGNCPHPPSAVLLAGGRLSGEMARAAGTDVKALVEFGGTTLLDRMIEAVRGAGVDEIVVVGPDALHGRTGDAKLVAEGSGGIENLFIGLDSLTNPTSPDRMLICATDLPFVTAEAVRKLLDEASDDASLNVPILRREAFEARFPEAPATYVRLTDGEWTSASVFVAHPGILSSMRPRLERVFAARKSQLGMARLLGPACTLKFLMRRLAVGDIERRACSLLGLRGVAMRGCPPELAFDVDLPAELKYVEKCLDVQTVSVPSREESSHAPR